MLEVKLSEWMEDCPHWWENFVRHEQLVGTRQITEALKKYHAEITVNPESDVGGLLSVRFATTADLAAFKLKYSSK